MDQKASEGRKHLNALKHESVQKREQIEKLQTTFRQLKLDDTRDCEFQIEQVSVNGLLEPSRLLQAYPSGAPQFQPRFLVEFVLLDL